MNTFLLQDAQALHRAGRLAEAAQRYAEILRGNPTDLGTAQTLIGLYFQTGRLSDALRIVDTALQFHSGSAALWNQRGIALGSMKRLDDSVLSFNRALALEPGFTGARLNRAHTLSNLRRHAEAVRDYGEVVKTDAAVPFARGNYLRSKLQCCDWTDLKEEMAPALAEMRAGKPSISPFVSTAFCESPADQLQAARIITALKYPPYSSPLWRGERYDHRRIRVAYLSADFHGHATAALTAGLFEHHDKTAFETIAVSFGVNDGSPMRRRLEAAFERFLLVPEKSPMDIARLLREMEIDIAIDLKGHTADARPGIFAFRPAPVAVNYLGYPSTMGAPYIDYLIADRIIIPEKDSCFYGEKIVYLPDCYQPNDGKREAPGHAPSRAEAGLSANSVVFCCFNNPFKITEDVFALWMEILGEVEDSVLWLLDDNPEATRNLKRAASRAGVLPERLVFAPHMPPAEHMARHALADLFLDTLPYNAHTTASDALWTGLPVLTCMGNTFAGRVAASLSQAVGLPELIADSPAAYRAMAIALARDSSQLKAIKEKLARNRKHAPLFDTGRTTRHLEKAYRIMHERSQRGLPPESFAVDTATSP